MAKLEILHVRYNERGADYLTRPHRQQHFQWYVVIEGAVRSEIGDREYVQGPFASQFIAPGTRRAHVFDRGPLRYLVVDFLADIQRFRRLGDRRAVLPAALRRDFQALVAELQRPRGGDAEVFIAAMVTTLLVRLARSLGRADRPDAGSAPQNQDEVVATVDNFLRHHLHRHLNRDEIATVVGCSAVHLGRLYKRAVGHTIWQQLTRMRIDRACELLRASDQPITAVALDVGFASFSQFSAAFRTRLGCTPTAWRRSASI